MEDIILNVDKRNGSICYNDKYHIYWDEKDETTLTSVTTLIGKYEQEFDAEFWLRYKALQAILGEMNIPSKESKSLFEKLRMCKIFDEKEILGMYNINSGYFSDKVKEIRNSWKNTNTEACEKGTKKHSLMEHKFGNTGKYSLLKLGITTPVRYEAEVHDFKYVNHAIPEMLVALKSGDLRIAGQVDLPVKLDDKIKVFDYKGLPLDTLIPTPDGFKPMECMQEGDIVFDRYGNKCKVTGVSDIHYNPCYKITLENGISFIADKEHRWVLDVYKKYESNGNTIYYLDMSSREFYETKEIRGLLDLGCKVSIPNTGHIKYDVNKPELPISMYELGFVSGLYNFSTGKIKAGENKDTVIEICNSNNIKPSDLVKIINSSFVMNGDECSFSLLYGCSLFDRLEFMKGVMSSCSINDGKDTVFTFNDGSFGIGFHYFMCSMRLMYSSMEDNYKKLSYNTFVLNKIIERKVSVGKVYIKSVERCDTVPTKCIEVDSVSHTYLFGKEYLTTHNTNKKLNFESYKDSFGNYQMMKDPLSDVMDCNVSHYQLQLSIYSYIINRIYGLSVMDPEILYIDNKDKLVRIPLVYDKDHVVALLRHYKANVNPKIEYKKVIKLDFNKYKLINS